MNEFLERLRHAEKEGAGDDPAPLSYINDVPVVSSQFILWSVFIFEEGLCQISIELNGIPDPMLLGGF